MNEENRGQDGHTVILGLQENKYTKMLKVTAEAIGEVESTSKAPTAYPATAGNKLALLQNNKNNTIIIIHLKNHTFEPTIRCLGKKI